jgi:hypothetical protein
MITVSGERLLDGSPCEYVRVLADRALACVQPDCDGYHHFYA